MSGALIDLSYVVAAVLFILGLKGLTHPRTAVRGNMLGALAMLLACVATLAGSGFDFMLIGIGLAIGTVVGVVLAVKIQMTAMPQLVALFNGFGGAASVLVAGAFLVPFDPAESENLVATLLATFASGLIGAVTFSGSLIAFAKLQELKLVRDLRFPGQQAINAGLTVACVAMGAWLVNSPEHAELAYWLTVVAALALGFFLVISIGGADMPVVIALLNSYSGLAAAATGFVITNNVLIVAGSLVGASGIILTRIMCVAMNRSLTNVLFGKMGASGGEGLSADEVYNTVKSTSADEVAMLLDVAERVCIVPGYGMAVAQAQHAVSDLYEELTKRGTTVEFGIHPVAGRMPGHMNVLLAEADIPYEALKEMDDVNREMERVDVTIVLGANDVVNPLARTDPSSPIAGMPIIDVDKSKTVVVIKRSLSPGFAQIPNPLFAADNTLMLFGDGRKATVDILKALQDG